MVQPGSDPSGRPLGGPTLWIPPLLLGALALALMFSGRVGPDAGPGPVVLYGLATWLALRERRQPWVPSLYVPATLFFLLWLLRAATGIVLPFLFALLTAYLLDPMVDRLERRFGRTGAVLLVVLPVLLVTIGLGLLVIPSLLGEVARLGRRLPELREPLLDLYGWGASRLEGLGVDLDRERVAGLLLDRLEQIGRALGDASFGVWRGVRGIVSLVGFLVITPVVTYYLLRDFDHLRAKALELMPAQRQEGTRGFFRRVDRSVSAYLRGQLLVGVVVGTLFTLGFLLLGLDSALLVGLSALLLNLVPFVGSFLTATLAISVALLGDPSWITLLKVGALYAVVQLLDAAVLSPRIMGHSLDLHPVAVMLALLLGGELFGLVGVLAAVPAAAVLKETFTTWTPRVVGLLPPVEEEPDP